MILQAVVAFNFSFPHGLCIYPPIHPHVNLKHFGTNLHIVFGVSDTISPSLSPSSLSLTSFPLQHEVYYKSLCLSNSPGLESKMTETDVPLGVYDGQQYLFRTGWWKLSNIVRSLWRYGMSLFSMNSAGEKMLSNFVRIYDIQAMGKSFKTVPELLRAMGGEEMYHLTQITAEQYMLRDLGLQEALTRELITGAMYMNYGQGLNVNALTCMVSLAGVQENSLWAVVGGNKLIPERALEKSGAHLHKCSVTSVTRRERGGRVTYTVETNEEDKGVGRGEYDVVIIAAPLHDKAIQFRDFPTPVYTEEMTATTYHCTVAEFVAGEINPAFFGLDENDRSFPLLHLITDTTQSLAPFPFCCVGVLVPSEEPESANAEYIKPFPEDRSRVWKIFTPRPLSGEEKRQMFKTIDAEATIDWSAYPNYSPPESFPPFELDRGVFYVNGIEKAASAMEMSAVGAMNCALLARDYLHSRVEES